MIYKNRPMRYDHSTGYKCHYNREQPRNAELKDLFRELKANLNITPFKQYLYVYKYIWDLNASKYSMYTESQYIFMAVQPYKACRQSHTTKLGPMYKYTKII